MAYKYLPDLLTRRKMLEDELAAGAENSPPQDSPSIMEGLPEELPTSSQEPTLSGVDQLTDLMNRYKATQNSSEAGKPSNDVNAVKAYLMGNKEAPPISPATVQNKELENKAEDSTEDGEEEISPLKPAPKGKALIPIDFGDKAGASVDQLKQLQDQQASNVMWNQLGKSSALIGAGLARTTPKGNELYDENIKNAGMPLQHYMQKVEFEKQDPNSGISKGYRQLLTKMGYDIQGQASAANLEHLFPVLAKMYDAEQSRQARVEQAHAMGQMRQDMMHEKREQKVSDDQGKAYSAAGKDLQSYRGNKAVAQAATNLLNASNAMSLINRKDPNTLTTQDLNLLAEEMGKIATGGVPGEHTVRQLLPNNLMTKVAELKNFIMSRPSDANAKAYILKNKQYLQELIQNSQNMIDRYKAGILHSYVKRLHPEDYKALEHEHQLTGIMPVDVATVHAAPHSGNNTSAQDMLKNLDSMSTDQVEEQLKQRGY